MPESETSVVFRILGVLAAARTPDHALAISEIVDAVHMGERHVERYMAVLQRAGTVRAQAARYPTSYTLTDYGLARLGR
jgi:DNA-binding IclR family transcriptional regulator